MSEDNNHEEKGSGIGCRTIALGGCLIILAAIGILIFLLVTRTNIILGTVIDFLNKDLETTSISSENTSYDILADVYSQIDEELEIQSLEFSEEEITILARESFEDLEDLTIDIESNKITLFWKAYSRVEDHPVLGVVTLNKESDNIEIDHFGTARIGFPKIVNKFVTSRVSNFIEQGENDSVNDFFLTNTKFEKQI
ncbi:MAG: hypothetical protein Q9M91_01965 [Candidatus Dojkabacteria bacterium]|nr:hypothetical protein [Candidatus Dojkabacteria bacterium]